MSYVINHMDEHGDFGTKRFFDPPVFRIWHHVAFMQEQRIELDPAQAAWVLPQLQGFVHGPGGAYFNAEELAALRRFAAAAEHAGVETGLTGTTEESFWNKLAAI